MNIRLLHFGRFSCPQGQSVCQSSDQTSIDDVEAVSSDRQPHPDGSLKQPVQSRSIFRKLLDSPAESITAFSTLVLVIYTAFLARYAADQTEIQTRQLAKIDRTLAQTDQLIIDANSQAKSSEIQASEAIKSNSLNRANSVVQLRPYISVTRVVPSNDSDALPSQIIMKNGGQTPTINTVFRTRMMILNATEIQRVLTRGLDDAQLSVGEDNSMLVGSGEEIKAVVNIDRLNTKTLGFEKIGRFSKSEVSDFKSGKKVLWISGFASYNDVFNKASRMRFCYVVESATLNLNRCKTNNDLTFYDGVK